MAGNRGHWSTAQLLLLVSRDDTHSMWETYGLQLPDMGEDGSTHAVPTLAQLAHAVWLQHLQDQVSAIASRRSLASAPSLGLLAAEGSSATIGASATARAAAGPTRLSRELSRGQQPASPRSSLGQRTSSSQLPPLPPPAPGGVRQPSAGQLPPLPPPSPRSRGDLGARPPPPTTRPPLAAHDAASTLDVYVVDEGGDDGDGGDGDAVGGGSTAQLAAAAAALTRRPSCASSEQMGHAALSTCAVCFERLAILHMTSCTHCMCASCSTRVVLLEARKAQAPPTCPFCSRNIAGFALAAPAAVAGAGAEGSGGSVASAVGRRSVHGPPPRQSSSSVTVAS